VFALYVVAGALTRLTACEPRRASAWSAAFGTLVINISRVRLPTMLGRRQWPAAALLITALVSAGQLANLLNGRGAVLQELLRVDRARHSLRRGRSCTASSPAGWPSRIASGRSSWDADSGTSRPKQRDDVQYVSTCVAPPSVTKDQCTGCARACESRTIRTFDVAETTSGHDRAALIDKFGDTAGETAAGTRLGSMPAGSTSRAQH
jgi:hypothetical protein